MSPGVNTTDEGFGAAEPFLALSGVGKQFGGVTALHDVDLEVRPGEVLGLLGENGAGKSTLIKIIAGVQSASGGRMIIGDQTIQDATPHRIRELGIETIYQDLALAGNLGVAENLFLGRELSGRALGLLPWLKRREMRKRTHTELDKLRIQIPSLRTPVANLSGGQQQSVAIARALYWQAQLVIMDEPTAALGVAEHDKVLELVHELASQGVAVILVTHIMQDALDVTDRIAVLTRGTKAMDQPTRELDRSRVVHAMLTGETDE